MACSVPCAVLADKVSFLVGSAHSCILLPDVQHKAKWLIFDDMSTGMGCSQGVDLDLSSHLDMLVDMLWKHHNMWLYCGSTSPSVIPRPSLPSATELP